MTKTSYSKNSVEGQEEDECGHLFGLSLLASPDVQSESLSLCSDVNIEKEVSC